MIGVDTNILLRFLLADEPCQHEAALRFLGERTRSDPAYVSSVVLCELVWVLRRRYHLSPNEIMRAIGGLLKLPEIRFEDPDFLEPLLAEGALSGDLSDHVIARLAERAGCAHSVTFDRSASRFVPSMTLLA